MERPLDGVPVAGPDDRNDRHYQTTMDRTAVEAFLRMHPTAKILFIVDTHSLENGYFIYAGDSPQNYLACSLLEAGSPSHVAIPHISQFSTDFTGLLPSWGIQISLQLRQVTEAPAQESHPQSLMWFFYLSGRCTEPYTGWVGSALPFPIGYLAHHHH